METGIAILVYIAMRFGYRAKDVVDMYEEIEKMLRDKGDIV